MFGYWFNFNRGYTQPYLTVKLNKRYIGMPNKPEIVTIKYLFGSGYTIWKNLIKYLFGTGYVFVTKGLIKYLFGNGYSFLGKGGIKYKFGNSYSIFDVKDTRKYSFASKYEVDW
ncbi:MAG: hypothetical protein NC131_11525 [Roseburia sp.]|nr:hypothetical protein [Roseburia sp.]